MKLPLPVPYLACYLLVSFYRCTRVSINRPVYCAACCTFACGFDQWCGNIDNPVPATERLLEFAKKGWKNKAFRQMTFGLYCPPMAFCQQAKVRPLPYPTLPFPTVAKCCFAAL